MEQWKIISKIYNLILLKISAAKYNGVDISVVVKDLCQTTIDKGRIIFNEKQYEKPTGYKMSVAIEFAGSNITDLLNAYGAISVLLKDDCELDIGKYSWHGSTTNKVYLIPVIRDVNHENEKYCSCDGTYKFEQVYEVEFSINSQKPYEFKRVEKREIYGVVKK